MTRPSPTLPAPRALLADADFLTTDADHALVVAFRSDPELRQDPSRIDRAVVYATAHGVYELTINGQPVTDSVLNPGWTAYEWRLQYQSFDVTDILRTSGRPEHRYRSPPRQWLVSGEPWLRQCQRQLRRSDRVHRRAPHSLRRRDPAGGHHLA